MEVGEVVCLGERGIVVGGRERERCAAWPAPDHLCREPRPADGIGAAVRAFRGAVEKAPEALDILAQLAEDEVGAVAPQIGAATSGLERENARRIRGGFEDRAVGVAAVLVRVAEHELAEAERGLGSALLRKTLE